MLRVGNYVLTLLFGDHGQNLAIIYNTFHMHGVRTKVIIDFEVWDHRIKTLHWIQDEFFSKNMWVSRFKNRIS